MPWQANRSNLPSMKIATGKVVGGKVVLEGVALEDRGETVSADEVLPRPARRHG